MGKQTRIEWPRECVASPDYVAVAAEDEGVVSFTHKARHIQTIPETQETSGIDIHPRHKNLLVLGSSRGPVRIWDVRANREVCSFDEKATHVRFVPDGRLALCLKSVATIFKFDPQFQIQSRIKLEGHTNAVNGIIYLPFTKQFVTSSDDKSVKVWDSLTASCLRTSYTHRDSVTSLALHPNGRVFASGSHDSSVIVWLSEPFQVKQVISFPRGIDSLVFGADDVLYAGVHNRGVVSCNARTGKLGEVLVPGRGSIFGLALGSKHCTAWLEYCTLLKTISLSS